jgi:hypothetical protein
VAEWHRDRGRPGHAHAADHADVRGVGDDDLVAVLDGGEQGIEEALGAAAGDDDLLVGVVGDAAAALKVLGDGQAQVVQAIEGQVRVGGVLANALAGRGDHCWRRRDVGVEVLEAQDLGVGAGGAGGRVDAELREAGEAAGTMMRQHCPVK